MPPAEDGTRRSFPCARASRCSVVRREAGVLAPERAGHNRTAIGVNWLSGFDFEIKVIARIPDKISQASAGRSSLA